MGENTLLFNSVLDSLTFFKPLGYMTSFKTGGNTHAYCEPDSLKNLCDCIEYCKVKGLPYKVIGNCSNILVSDYGYKGVIISLKKLSRIKILDNGEIKVGAGANLSSLINFCADNGLSGVENLSGIPATIGGAITMNAGAFLSCISDHIIYVETVKNGKLFRYGRENCKFHYRKSRFLHCKDVIVSANFSLNRDNKNNIKNRIAESLNKRKSLHPVGRTCGSVFKNPKGYYAGELIERARLKGYKIGGAQVSQKHANFIIANDGCTSLDVYKLISFIKLEVFNKFNVKLNEELEYLGEF